MTQASPPPLTPKEKAERRTGPCIAVVCRDRCEFFVYNQTKDSFRTCECGHTQHAHAEGVEQ